jgi:hypothetical protein
MAVGSGSEAMVMSLEAVLTQIYAGEFHLSSEFSLIKKICKQLVALLSSF